MKRHYKWCTRHFNFGMEIIKGVAFGYAKEHTEHFILFGCVIFSIEYTK